MQLEALKPFDDLAHKPGYVKLDWFGGVYANLRQSDNPLLECMFTPVKFETGGKILQDIKQQFRAKIAVGYLPALFLGRVFENGRPTRNWPGKPFETIDFQFDPSNEKETEEVVLENVFENPRDAFLSERNSAGGTRAGLKRLHGTLTASTNPATQEKLLRSKDRRWTRKIVLIHELELIRFYLTNSEHSCRNIFNGAFADHRIFKDVFNATHEKPGFYPKINKHRFVYRFRYREADAPTLGRILFEPDKLALRAAQRVHSSMIANNINFEDGTSGYPRTSFPFKSPTTLQLEGRWIKVNSSDWVFLAHRILGCSAPFPFEGLSFCREVEPGGTPPPSDAKPAFPYSNRQEHGPDADDPSAFGNSVNDEHPSMFAPRVEADLGFRQFGGLQGVDLERKKLLASKFKSGAKISIFVDGLINSSAGSGTSGKTSSIGQSLITRNVKPSLVTPDIENFIRTLVELRADKPPKWKLTTLAMDRGCQLNGEWHAYFPEVNCEKRKSQIRQFSFMDGEQTVPRSYICVEVSFADAKLGKEFVYLFEAQRRPRESNEAGKAAGYKEQLPILLLKAIDGQQVEPKDFQPMIKATVVKKTWPSQSELHSFVRDETMHGMGAQTVAAVSARVRELIDRNLGND